MQHQKILNLLNEKSDSKFVTNNWCITKIDGTTDDAEDLDLVMLMYNLLEYISSYSDTAGSVWFYSKDKATNFNADVADTNDFKSFKHKAKLLGKTEANGANGILKSNNSCTIKIPK